MYANITNLVIYIVYVINGNILVCVLLPLLFRIFHQCTHYKSYKMFTASHTQDGHVCHELNILWTAGWRTRKRSERNWAG